VSVCGEDELAGDTEAVFARRRLLWLIFCSAASALRRATLTGPWAKRALIDDDQGALRARSLGLNVLGNV
jgi:hypothetical protein